MKLQKMEIELFDFTSFFWPGLFLIFWPTVSHDVKTTLLVGFSFNFEFCMSQEGIHFIFSAFIAP